MLDRLFVLCFCFGLIVCWLVAIRFIVLLDLLLYFCLFNVYLLVG